MALALVDPTLDSARGVTLMFHVHRLLHLEKRDAISGSVPDSVARSIAKAARQAVGLPSGGNLARRAR